MTARGIATLLAIAAALLAFAAPAAAQKDPCAPVRAQLLFDGKMQQQQQQQQQMQQQQVQQKALSSDLLFGGADTMLCLVEVLDGLKEKVREPELSFETSDLLLRASGAIRSILATQGQAAIREFRTHDDPDTISVLAFAARSADPGLRINATLVLADVIDNSTVCVPIDHLYDPSLLKSPGGESGRINLMGVVSVVAPWAYRENFDNIARLVGKLDGEIDPKGTKQAHDVLTNLEARLAFQKKGQAVSNMGQPLPPRERDCSRYVPLWANAGDAKNLVY